MLESLLSVYGLTGIIIVVIGIGLVVVKLTKSKKDDEIVDKYLEKTAEFVEDITPEDTMAHKVAAKVDDIMEKSKDGKVSSIIKATLENVDKKGVKK
jgi:hypothetical protein